MATASSRRRYSSTASWNRLNFVVNPVVVGSGTTLLRPGQRTGLRLVWVTERRNGAVTLSYANA